VSGPLTDERVRWLLEDIRSEARFARESTGREGVDERVLAAVARVPRHLFVPEQFQDDAYANRPLPIGHGQTISQPYVVALMTDLLGLGADAVVLEVGTGCGYQTAVLAQLAREVYSIEIVEPLGTAAAERLAALGYGNIEVRIGDGYAGWPEHAPYDGIVVTAAAPEVPPALVEQLKPGGRLVIPVGAGTFGQTLMLLTRRADGGVDESSVLPVAFVPFTRSPHGA
jgi:protein-L-isoaspartate(D-aspartate) O-methyltransferase